MVTATQTPATPVRGEIERWKQLGVATLPGPRGQKGPREPGWPTMQHAEAWALTEAAAARGPINLVVRTGATADGTKWLAAIDLDGKCPCGHDRSDHSVKSRACRHRGEQVCACGRYRGVAPAVALERLLAVLPESVGVNRTGRGFHVVCFVRTPTPNGALPDLSADVFGGLVPHALQVAPSLHPSGHAYEWLQAPGDDLPTVDLAALGLAPSPADVRSVSASQATHGRARRSPAPPSVQQQFIRLMRGFGIEPSGAREEFLRCAWHADDEPSLHIAWDAANFFCFGCGEQGGLRRLSALADATLPPSCSPSPEDWEGIGRGLQLGGNEARAERDRLADALETLGELDRAARVRICREATLDAADADIEAFICPNGDATPAKARMISCDEALCPMCMPWRLAADWRHHWSRRECAVPQHLTLLRLRSTAVSGGLHDGNYVQQTRARFREWQRERHLRGGLYGLTLQREGDVWRAVLLVAVGAGDADRITDGRAFAVEIARSDLDGEQVLRALQESYITEATTWRDTDELAALRGLLKGRRKFQGFGTEFGAAGVRRVGDVEEETQMSKQTDAYPLHRMSGGSGSGSKQRPCCPRCGGRLKAIGRFDPRRMRLAIAADGVTEWQWRDRTGGQR